MIIFFSDINTGIGQKKMYICPAIYYSIYLISVSDAPSKAVLAFVPFPAQQYKALRPVFFNKFTLNQDTSVA